MTVQYILRKSMCRESHCFSAHIAGKGYTNDGSDPSTRADYDRQRMRAAESEIDNLNWAAGYAEPGYTDPKRGIVFANWNVFPSDIDQILERAGYAIEWSDEWSTCDDCGKAVRTSGNSYHWQPAYVLIDDCSTVCRNCVDWADYLEKIEDDPHAACVADCDPEEFGYQRLSDGKEFESGFFTGQTDDPAKILEQLHATGRKRIVFRLAETSQFYVKFETWIKVADDDSTDDDQTDSSW